MGVKIIAVVLNWRDFDSTASCVASLEAEAYIDTIVVVDNESEGLLAPLRRSGIELIERAENSGFAGGVNVGIKRASELGADAILVINNDAVLCPGALDTLVAAWRSTGFADALFAPTIVNPDGSLQSTGGRYRASIASTTDMAAAGEANFVTWACVFLPRGLLARTGALDEGFFMYWEDVEFGLRMGDLGLPIQVVEGARVSHAKSASHEKAGAAIDRYSARGLVVLARRRGGVGWVGAGIRVAARLLRRLAERRFVNARAVLRGGWEGLAADLPPAPMERG